MYTWIAHWAWKYCDPYLFYLIWRFCRFVRPPHTTETGCAPTLIQTSPEKKRFFIFLVTPWIPLTVTPVGHRTPVETRWLKTHVLNEWVDYCCAVAEGSKGWYAKKEKLGWEAGTVVASLLRNCLKRVYFVRTVHLLHMGAINCTRLTC